MPKAKKQPEPETWSPAADPLYMGIRHVGGDRTVTVNGEPLKVRQHENRAPVGLQWIGWGPKNTNGALLAWALLMHATEDAALADEVKAEFLRTVVNRWHASGFLICRSAILSHVRRIREELAGRIPRSL